MKRAQTFSLLPAMLCALGLSASERHANAADLICHEGWSVYQCGDGSIFPCVFNGGGPDAYQVDCIDYPNFASAADFYCHDRGGVADIVNTGMMCEPAEGDVIRDEDQDQDQDIEEAPHRR